MPDRLELPDDPEMAARALLARYSVRHPREIVVELIAWQCGADVVYRPAGSADARVVRAGDRAYLVVAAGARGTLRARFSIAHELAHYLLHADLDAIARIHGERKSSREYAVEYHADVFASELLVPVFLAAPMCEREVPTLDAVATMARTFGVSLTVAAKKWARLAQTGCAFVESKGNVIKRVVRSAGFQGIAIERRELREGCLALEIARSGREGGVRAHSATARIWGSGLVGSEVVEECVPLGEGGRVLTWLRHA